MLLKHKSFDAWFMYSLVFEHHWRPKDILEMEEWELGVLWALTQQHGKEIEKLRQ